MRIVPFEMCHVREAGILLLEAYQNERMSVPGLPPGRKAGFFAGLVEPLAGNGLGVAILEGDTLTGFLTGMAAGTLFGTSPGIYIPLYAHAVKGKDRGLAYQRLYAEASENWVSKGCLSHAITLYAHDDAARDAWFRQNFGLRCVDAIQSLNDFTIAANTQKAAEIRRLKPEEAGLLLPLHLMHLGYYRRAPMFMHVREDCTQEELRAWMGEKDRHVFAAFEEGVPVAYMQLCHGGESFVSDDEKTMNICGAYVRDELRQSGVGAAVLRAVVIWLRENGFERLGVDYESFNIRGSRFWEKYFTPFTFSMTRRVDERIIP